MITLLGKREGSIFFGKVVNSACRLFILWLLYCICLSFPFVVGEGRGGRGVALDVDLIVSVPEFSYFTNGR